MAILQIIQIECHRIWRNKIMRIALFAIAAIPLLYSSLYLMAFWDPYGQMNKLPVALVNEDIGAMHNGTHVNYGADITKKLVDDNTLLWTKTSNSNAMKGVTDGKYYMVLRIPSNFSQSITSVSTSHPEAAQLDFIPNQGENYLAGQIVGRVQNELSNALSQRFSKEYISALLTAVGKEADGLSTISTNASKLADGANKVASGSSGVLNGTVQAKSGANQLVLALSKITPASSQIANGLQQTSSATSKIKTGITQGAGAIGTIRSGITPLAGPTSQLAAGMNQLATGSSQLVSSSKQLQSGSTKAAQATAGISSGLQTAQSGTSQLANQLSQVNTLLIQSHSSDPNVNQAMQIVKELMPSSESLVTSLGQLQSGASELSASENQIAAGQEQLTSGLTQYQQSLSQMNQGVQSFSDNLGKVDNGLNQVESGLNQASEGLQKLSVADNQLFTGTSQMHDGLLATTQGARALDSGVGALQSGTQKLNEGALSLSQNEQTFAGKVANAASLAKVNNTGSTASIMANPIKTLTHTLNPVSQYGPGFVPYFVPLSLWVGAIMLSFLVSLREGRWRLSPVSPQSVVLGKLFTLWILAAVQAIIASIAILYGLGLHVNNVFGFFAFNIFSSITYASVILLFIGLLGTGPGRFMGIILLVLQLTSSAGTFPIVLVPSVFQTIHPFMPMTYGVTELRNIIAIHDSAISWHSILTTAVYLMASVLILMLLGTKKTSAKELNARDHLIA